MGVCDMRCDMTVCLCYARRVLIAYVDIRSVLKHLYLEGCWKQKGVKKKAQILWQNHMRTACKKTHGFNTLLSADMARKRFPVSHPTD